MLLTHCPFCTSRLIFPTEVVEWDDASVVTRRCPECDHEDEVLAGTDATNAWIRREHRIADSLRGLAEALADGLAVEPSPS